MADNKYILDRNKNDETYSIPTIYRYIITVNGQTKYYYGKDAYGNIHNRGVAHFAEAFKVYINSKYSSTYIIMSDTYRGLKQKWGSEIQLGAEAQEMSQFWGLPDANWKEDLVAERIKKHKKEETYIETKTNKKGITTSSEKKRKIKIQEWTSDSSFIDDFQRKWNQIKFNNEEENQSSIEQRFRKDSELLWMRLESYATWPVQSYWDKYLNQPMEIYYTIDNHEQHSITKSKKHARGDDLKVYHYLNIILREGSTGIKKSGGYADLPKVPQGANLSNIEELVSLVDGISTLSKINETDAQKVFLNKHFGDVAVTKDEKSQSSSLFEYKNGQWTLSMDYLTERQKDNLTTFISNAFKQQKHLQKLTTKVALDMNKNTWMNNIVNPLKEELVWTEEKTNFKDKLDKEMFANSTVRIFSTRKTRK